MELAETAHADPNLSPASLGAYGIARVDSAASEDFSLKPDRNYRAIERAKGQTDVLPS